jgi:RNA polymerase sigma-70 factor (ECF subfamily)
MYLSPASDGAVLARGAAGDRAAFDILYARYAHTATTLALRILHDPVLVEDAVQEAFLAVWRRAPTYDPARGSVRSWLLTIVRHRAIDERRRRHADRWVDVAALDEASDDRDTHALACQHAEVHLVRAALARLPAPQRASLTLAYAADYTHPQIARAHGVPLGTVKGRLRLGLRALRTHLGDHDGAAL